MAFGIYWGRICLTISSFFVTGLLADHCTNEQLNKCFEFRNELLNISSGYFLLTQLSEDLLDDYCNIFERVTKSCLEGMILHCNEEAAGKLQGYNDANTFMCEEGYPDLLEVKNCLNREDTHRQLLICTEQYRIETENIAALDKYADLKYCQATEELIDCEADALEHTCSTEAGQWTRTYNTKFYQAYLTALFCTPSTTAATTEKPSDLPDWVIAVAVVGGLLLVIALITAVICIVRKSSRTKHNHHRNLSSSTRHPQPAVTVIVDNRHLDPRKEYRRYPSTASEKSKHHHASNPKRLPRSNSSDSHGGSSQGTTDNTYTHLSFKQEDVRYHRDPTSQNNMDSQVTFMPHHPATTNGVINSGFVSTDPPKEDIEEDYLHPVGSTLGSSNIYQELPDSN